MDPGPVFADSAMPGGFHLPSYELTCFVSINHHEVY